MAAPGRGLTVGQLNIDEAIVWPQQGRLLEAWATRLREAREEFAEDPPMRSLVESAAGDYLTALADAQLWAGEEWRHHFQPAWAAAIAAHDRFRGRRAAMRNSREYRVWPVSACEAGMLYAVGPDESTGDPIDLSDTHSRLGRMAITRRVALSDETVPAVVLAETPAQVADALTAALSVPVEHDEPQAAATDDAGAGVGDVSADDAAAADDVETSAEPQSPAAAPPAHDDEELHPAEESAPPRRRSSPGGGTKAAPAAVHAGLRPRCCTPTACGSPTAPEWTWPSRSRMWDTSPSCPTDTPSATSSPPDSLSRARFGSPTRHAGPSASTSRRSAAATGRSRCAAHRRHRLRRPGRRRGWSLDGAGEDPNAHRLGTWTRVYRDDKRGVMVALIPGMGTGPDEMPILAEEPTPAQIARRLQLLADALRFPWKINAGVTAVDLMLQARPKTWSPQDWRDVVFAPSTTTPPFGIGDVESDFDWSRPPTSDERKLEFVHAYDRGGSYVAGIAGLEVPIGDPVHHPDGAPFDPKTPGCWLADIPERADWRLPYVLNPRGLQFTGPKWVCTRRLERAIKLGYQPQIHEAWIWPQHSRNVLLGWYERFRDASATLDTDDPDAQAARNQTKVIRTHGIGIIGSDEHLKGKTGYNPERRLHIMAKANANIVYRLHQIGERTGQWPLAVATDTVLYASHDPDPVTAWPGHPGSFGRGFGQYKPEPSGLLAEHLDYLNGRDYRGKRVLTPAAEWRESLPRNARC